MADDQRDEKTIAGVPYDLRRPTRARSKARSYNPDDPRLFLPKSFGIGWNVNLYWALHPATYLRRRR